MLAKNNEYLEETAESLFMANADEIVRQQCLAREDAERRERTLERDNLRLREINETLKEDNETLKEDNETLKEEKQRAIYSVVELCKEMGLTFDATLEKLAEKFEKSTDEMREQIAKFWNE